MPKKTKLNIKDLKVQSFVTSLEEDSQSKVKGGLPETCAGCQPGSYTYIWWCPPTVTFEVECRSSCGCTAIKETYCPCL